MVALTLRSVKGSELTAAEIDANFTNLNTDKLSSTAAGYPAIRTSLNLDFANSQSVDPRITFTRASTATRVNANGLIEVVASGSPRIDFDPETDVCKGLLIEEQRTNLLTYSENFDDAAWAKSNATITANAMTAPDGTATADKLVENTTTGIHRIYNITAGTTNTNYYISSIFAKAGERTSIYLAVVEGGTYSRQGQATFNLLTGTVYSTNTGTNGAAGGMATITPYGNGWYKCSYSVILGGTDTSVFTDFMITQTPNTSTYLGDGTSGLYIWGAQLEAGSFATSYIPSSDTFTSRASTATYVGSNGLVQSALTNVARYNYNPVNLALAPKLLLESASTNLLTYSEQFDNAAWAKSNTTITANAMTAPDGTATADKLVENTTTGTHRIYDITAGATNTNYYTSSIFAKAGERTSIYLAVVEGGTFSRQGQATFNLLTGTVYSTNTGTNGAAGGMATITPYGNGWYKCSYSVILGGTDTSVLTDFMITQTPNTSTYLGDGTSGLYIWGAQLEASSFPTSYIPTVASQVTRAADISSSAQTTRVADTAVMTGTNFSSWYNQTEGTILSAFDHYMPTSTGYDRVYEINDNTNNNYITVDKTDGSGTFFSGININGVPQEFLYTSVITSNTVNKLILTYKINDFAQVLNGGTVQTDVSGNVPVVSRMGIGCNPIDSASQLNGHISKLSYYPKRLTNSELQALTTG